MRLVYLLLSLFSVGAALKSFLEDSLGDYCHECEYPHFIGPRPDPFTTLSCIHQVMPETPRVRVQYMLREHPICITMLVFDGLMPVYQIRTGVPASSLPSKCYEYREKGGYYIPDLTMNITVSEGVQLDWQSEKDNPQNFHDFIALRLHGEGPNKEFTGAVMCCGTTLCNADDVEFYLPTRISQGYEREADWRRSMPFVLVIAVLAITLWPHLTKVQEENRVTALEKIERAMVLSDDWFGFPAPVCILHPDAEAVSAKFYPPMTERALRRIRAEKGCRDKEARDYAAFRRLQAVLRGLEKAPPRARDSSVSKCEEYPVYTVSSQMLQKRGVRSGCILYVSPGGIEAARFTSHDQHPEAETWMDRTAHGWPRRGSAVPRSYDTSKEEKDGEKKGNKASA
ncbi:unnamed protein product, partial [Mesorhabditis spiculigera]